MFNSIEECNKTFDCQVKFIGLQKMIKSFPIDEVIELRKNIDTYGKYSKKYHIINECFRKRLGD